MRQRVRENALAAACAGGALAVIAWLGLYGYGWNDYDLEAKPALDALTAGHVLEFLRLAPAYGGSLVERAPFALLPGLWGGGPLAVYRAVSIPCLVVAAAAGVWLVARMRASGRSRRLARGLVLAVFVANPITLDALEVGHPEELMIGALCVVALIAASDGRALAAGVLAGLAIAGKEWALIALGPVLLALPASAAPRAREGRPAGAGASRRKAAACALAAGATAAVVLAPLLLAGGQRFLSVTRGVASTSSAIFQPWQIWWFLGHHGPAVYGTLGEIKPGYRTAPAWVGPLSHPAVVLVAVLASAAVWLARRRRAPADRAEQALLLLALVLMARCLLDTWDYSYYLLPATLALAAWESLIAPHRPPVATWAATLLGWATFVWLRDEVSADAQSALFLAWALPFTAALALRLYAPARFAACKRALSGLCAPVAALATPLGPQAGGAAEGRARPPAGLTRSS